MSLSAREVQEVFERIASDWDTMRLAYYDERVIERMAAVSDLDEGMTVADVGTGTGFVAAGIAPRAGKVIAVDNSSAMLEVARKNLSDLGLENVELVEGDVGAAWPIESGSADAVFANMVLHHAEDPTVMLREMARVVKPGGVVAVVDEVEHPYAWMREEQADVWLGFTPEQVEGFFKPRTRNLLRNCRPARAIAACERSSIIRDSLALSSERLHPGSRLPVERRWLGGSTSAVCVLKL
jgi:ArsR family transcriptional regulator